MRQDADILISFSPADNQPRLEHHEGWVARFHRSLHTRLTQLLGATPHIELQSSQTPGVSASLLLAVMSPDYLRDEHCMMELQSFFEHITQEESRAAAQSRVLAIVKTPVDSQPDLLQGVAEFDFTREDHQADDSKDAVGVAKSYWAAIDDLAYTIRDRLAPLKHSGSVEVSSEQPMRVIYLAEAASDLREERERIARELNRHGYTLLGSYSAADGPLQVQERIRSEIDRSILSIHLIGGRYDTVPQGMQQSLSELQYIASVERVRRDSSFTQLVWMPHQFDPPDERQKQFIQQIREGVGSAGNVELIQISLEDFKTIIADKLHREVAQKPEPVQRSGQMPQLYMMYDRRDVEAVAPLREYVAAQGIDVILSIFEGDQVQLRQHHQQSLSTCDAALIFYGRVSEPWVRIKQQDLLKSAGFGRLRPMVAKAVYLGPERTDSKLRFDGRDATVIQNFEMFTPAIIQPFLESIRSAGRGVVQ